MQISSSSYKFTYKDNLNRNDGSHVWKASTCTSNTHFVLIYINWPVKCTITLQR